MAGVGASPKPTWMNRWFVVTERLFVFRRRRVGGVEDALLVVEESALDEDIE